jgi:uncharacterized protein (TIGR03435 family)
MRKLVLSLVMLLVLVPTTVVWAQNIADTWQGTLSPPAQAQGRPPLRLVMKITRNADETLKATLYSIDQNPTPINASAVSLQGSTFKMAVAAIGANYEGKLSSDGNTISGTMTQGPAPVAMEWVRATPATAWVIPEPPPPPKVMAADAKPQFEVSTIKPSRPDAQGRSILVGRGGANMLTTTNTPLIDLIIMSYGLHPRQVLNVPAWVENEKYDITAKPDQEGVPNIDQLKVMIQGLLADRFQLKFHNEKRELSVYAVTVVKGGPKMAKVETPRGNLPGFGGPPGRIQVRNSTMSEFAGFLQSRIVERPVVDQTGLTDRYDFQMKWIPDPAQLAQLPPGAPPLPPPDDDAAPDVFAAMQNQLGLKLESTKAPVDVLVIDKVEKPSEN